MSRHMFFFWFKKSKTQNWRCESAQNRWTKNKKNNQKEWKTKQEKHTEKKVKEWKKKKRDENKNEVKIEKKRREKSEEINKNTKRGLKNGSEKSSHRQLKNAKTEIKKKNKHRQERKLFLKCSFNLGEKVRKHLLVNCFKKMVRNTYKNNFYTFFVFVMKRTSKKGQKKKQNQIVKKVKKVNWLKKREREKQHISGRVFFEPFPHLSPKKGKNKEKRFILQSCKHVQKEKLCFEKGHSRKGNLTKNDFFERRANTETRYLLFLSERVKDSENKTTHTKKRKRKNKKRNENIQKRKRTKDPSQQKRWTNDRQIRNKAKTKFPKGTRRGRDSENTRRHWKKHQKKGETQKMKKSKKIKKIMIYTEKIRKDRINDNRMHMRLGSPNHVTTRRNCQQSVQSRTRSLTRVNLEISFLFFKWEMCSLFPEKVPKKQSFRKHIFLERVFFKGYFLFGVPTIPGGMVGRASSLISSTRLTRTVSLETCDTMRKTTESEREAKDQITEQINKYVRARRYLTWRSKIESVESKVENEMLSVKMRLTKTIRWSQVKSGADAEKQVSDDAKKAGMIGLTYETLKMRKKVQVKEDFLQKLSKENGKDDTELRNFAAKMNRLGAAVQPQQSTRSLETAQLELRTAKDAEAAKRGKSEVRNLNIKARGTLLFQAQTSVYPVTKWIEQCGLLADKDSAWVTRRWLQLWEGWGSSGSGCWCGISGSGRWWESHKKAPAEVAAGAPSVEVAADAYPAEK